jgi:hypothetical protein
MAFYCCFVDSYAGRRLLRAPGWQLAVLLICTTELAGCGTRGDLRSQLQLYKPCKRFVHREQNLHGLNTSYHHTAACALVDRCRTVQST